MQNPSHLLPIAALTIFAANAGAPASACSYSGSSPLAAASVTCSDTTDFSSWIDTVFYTAARNALIATVSAEYQSTGSLANPSYHVSDSFSYDDATHSALPVISYVWLNVESLTGSLLAYNTNTNTNTLAAPTIPFIPDKNIGGLSANLAVPGPAAGAGLPAALIILGLAARRRRAT